MARTQFNVRLPDTTLEQIGKLSERYESQSHVIMVAVDRLYREEFLMSSIATKASVELNDDKPTIVSKIRKWIDGTIPGASVGRKADQALFAWNGILTARGETLNKDTDEKFRELWGEGADGALLRQERRWA